MSGICSAHRGHDFDCLQCAAVPVDKAELLYTAWCMEFAPEPSWWDEDEVVRARWRNVANILWPPTPENVECPTCRGRTYLWVGDGKERRHVECPDCNGTGRTTPENVEEPT